MHYCQIKDCDIADGPGVRVTLFVSGCRNHCPGCFQQETWDFQYGKPFDRDVEDRLLSMLKPDYICGLTLLGGEPFEPENQRALYPFLQRVRAEYPGKSIWYFSGYTFEEMLREGAHPHTECTEAILALGDMLVDGRFILEQKDLTLRFRGSRNQRILMLPESLKAREPVHWPEENLRG